MRSKKKLYRVLFTDTRYMRIDLKATSAEAAEQLYIDGDPGDKRFQDFGGDAFHDATAEEVHS